MAVNRQWRRLPSLFLYKQTESQRLVYLITYSCIDATKFPTRESFSKAVLEGGRTNAVTLYYKADEIQGQQIKYVEVTSLYPWANKYRGYPVGHPKIITHPKEQTFQTTLGFHRSTTLCYLIGVVVSWSCLCVILV